MLNHLFSVEDQRLLLVKFLGEAIDLLLDFTAIDCLYLLFNFFFSIREEKGVHRLGRPFLSIFQELVLNLSMDADERWPVW